MVVKYILESIDIESHLKSRDLDFNKTHVVMNKKDGAAYFFLYNTSGKLVGYQRYNPAGSKYIRGNNKNAMKVDLNLMKYRTYVSNREIAVYGMETYDISSRVLFIVEGIFDCIKIHNAGYPAIAMLSNGTTQSTISWLHTLPQTKIVIYDNDATGKQLRKLGDASASCPDPYKDLGEMPQSEVNTFLRYVLSNKN